MMRLILMLAAVLMAACGTKKNVTADISHDSVKVVEKVVYATDTVYFDVPHIVEKNITADTTSFLENDYALSAAKIDSLGMLHHMLSTKPHKIPIRTKTKIIYKDSILSRYVKVPYPVERQLTWGERIRIDLFPVMLGVIILIIVFFIIVRRHQRMAKD